MRTARTSVSLLALLFCSAATVVAQTPIRVGQTVSGRLTNLSRTAEDKSFYDLYTYNGSQGERVRVTMRSSDFDAYLSFGRVGPEGTFERIGSNDDGAGGTDALMEVTLPFDGLYAIRANTLAAGKVGAYTLRLEQGGAATSAASATVRAIRIGQTVSGALDGSDPTLDDDSYYDLWSFQGQAGQAVTATLRSSDFDAFLVLGRIQNGSFEEIKSDDDGGGGTNALVSASLPAAGTYVLRVNTLNGNETGAYSLELTTGSVASNSSAGTALHPQAQPIRAGQTVRGTLSERDPVTFDGTHFQDWTFSGRKGDRIVVTLRSTAFDSYLQFGRAENGRFGYISAEDDGGGGNDSLMATTLPDDGEYVLRVNTLHKSTGAYSLVLEKLSTR